MAKSKNLADEKQTGLFWRLALTLFKNPIEWNHFSWIIILGCKWTLKIVFMNTFEENNPWFYYTHNTSLSVLCRQYIGSVVGVLSIYNFEEDLRPIFSKFKTVKKIEFKSRGIFMITSPQTRHLRDLGAAHYSQNCLISSKTFSKRRFDLQIRVNSRKKTMTDMLCSLMELSQIVWI